MPRFSPSASAGSIVLDISTHPAAADLHFHLFVAERRLVGLAIGEEQRVLVARGEQVVQEHRVEKHVTIQDHEPLIKQRSCHPERVHAVGLCVPGVLNVGNSVPTGAADPIGLAADDHGDIVDAGALEQSDLALDSVMPPDLDQALRRFAGRAVEPRAFARGQNDSSHVLCVPVFAAEAAATAAGRPTGGHAARRPWRYTSRGRAVRSR